MLDAGSCDAILIDVLDACLDISSKDVELSMSTGLFERFPKLEKPVRSVCFASS